MTSTFNNIYIKGKLFFLEDLVEFYGIQNSLLLQIYVNITLIDDEL